MATLELAAIEKSYGDVAVIHGIDLAIGSGEFCVFVGPSGCGKSTLLRMIAGLEDITAGDVLIDGQVVNHITAARRGLAMVFQSYALYPHMSVRNNLSFGLENLQMPRAEIDVRVSEAARMLQIEELLSRKPGQLSGGQRQRVAIGRAVVREPKIFLFDEPLSNLDAELRVAMRGEIADLHRRLGNTMIYVTHDQVEAMTMADKIAVLRLGRLEQYGKPLDLYNKPANLFVAGFIGSPRMNFLKGQISGSSDADLTVALEGGATVSLDRQRFDGAVGQAVSLGVRANHMTVAASADAALTMRIDTAEHLGSETYLYGSVEGDVRLTLHVADQASHNAGDTIGVAIDRQKAHLFAEDTGQSLAV